MLALAQDLALKIAAQQQLADMSDGTSPDHPHADCDRLLLAHLPLLCQSNVAVVLQLASPAAPRGQPVHALGCPLRKHEGWFQMGNHAADWQRRCGIVALQEGTPQAVSKALDNIVCCRSSVGTDVSQVKNSLQPSLAQIGTQQALTALSMQ